MKREKVEADAEVPGWNNALKEVEAFVQQESGSKKAAIIKNSPVLRDPTIKQDSDKLINAITKVNNRPFLAVHRNITFGTKKAH